MNKNQQKTFFNLGRAGFAAPGPGKQKVFCAAFFQKSGCFPVSIWIYHALVPEIRTGILPDLHTGLERE